MFTLASLFHSHEEKAFVAWMRDTNAIFTGDEYHFRFGIWSANHRLVQEHNKKGTFTTATNKFAAMTPAEYRSLLGHKVSSQINGVNKPLQSGKASTSWDWREKNVVNAVKDQGQCGSCWAFSVVQAMESLWALQKSELPILSEQNLVDCVNSCYGCGGGDEYISYEYVLKHQNGLWMTESDYPYTAKDGNCKFNIAKGVCKFSSWSRPTTTQNEKELADYCQSVGVVSVAIDAGQWSFQSYHGGIYDEPRCSKTWLNHAVGLVGFGEEGGVGYWIIRNSWGSSWGEKGYIRMIRGKGNQCGVATDTVIPAL